MFTKIRELAKERCGCRSVAPQRKDLLELIDDEHRRDKVVARPPKLGGLEELPERDTGFVEVPGQREIHGGLPAGLPDFRDNVQNGMSGFKPEPADDRKETRLAKPRHDPCTQKRGLPHAGAGEDHGERIALDQAQHFRGLAFPPEKPGAIFLPI